MRCLVVWFAGSIACQLLSACCCCLALDDTPSAAELGTDTVVYVGLERHVGAVGWESAVLDAVEPVVFFPNGAYRQRLPIRGLAGDMAWERRNQLPLWGTWERAGDTVVVHRGGDATFTVRDDDTLVSERGRPFTRLPSASGPFEGTWARDGVRSPGAPRLALHADGSYQDVGGFLRMVGNTRHLVEPDGDALGSGWTQARTDAVMGPGAGTYTYGDFTFTFRCDDGRVWQLDAFLPPGVEPPSPVVIVMNTYKLVRE